MRLIQLPKLEIWQRVVFDDVIKPENKGHTFLVVAKRQVGKSILAVCLLIKYALENKGSCGIIIEPTQNQSRRVFKQICSFLQGANVIKSANATLLNIEFVNGSEILLKSAEQDEALRGMTVKNSLLVIDEGAFIKDEIYEILYPTTDANDCSILIISTPLFQSGEFYNVYIRGCNGDRYTHVYEWSNYDTSKYLSKEKLEHYRETVTPQKFLSEYLGQFIKEGSYLFGDLTDIIKEVDDAPVFGGIDWANGDGNDYTVLTLMNNKGNVVKVHAFNKLSPTEQIAELTRIINTYPTLKNIQAELNSMGETYFDFLKANFKGKGIQFYGFDTTNSSKRRIIEALIKAVQTKAITIPNIAELLKEMQHYAIEKTQKGYTYNGANGVHDDYVISLALAYELYTRLNNSFSIRWA